MAWPLWYQKAHVSWSGVTHTMNNPVVIQNEFDLNPRVF